MIRPPLRRSVLDARLDKVGIMEKLLAGSGLRVWSGTQRWSMGDCRIGDVLGRGRRLHEPAGVPGSRADAPDARAERTRQPPLPS